MLHSVSELSKIALAIRSVGLSPSEPCKNGWNDRDAVCIEDSGGPKEPPIERFQPNRPPTVMWAFHRIQPSSYYCTWTKNCLHRKALALRDLWVVCVKPTSHLNRRVITNITAGSDLFEETTLRAFRLRLPTLFGTWQSPPPSRSAWMIVGIKSHRDLPRGDPTGTLCYVLAELESQDN